MFADDIEYAAEGEAIIGIVIGRFGWASRDESDSEAYGFSRIKAEPIPEEKKGVVLTWEEARPLLAYNYDAGFGASECHAIYAWTESRVLFVVEYDGATWVSWAPRNPMDVMPGAKGSG